MTSDIESLRSSLSSEKYDIAYALMEFSPLFSRLWADAWGDQYPREVEPFSACSWWVLGHAVAHLRAQPGDMLIDLGCGRGGPGLWLARALSARLVGVDFSAGAVAAATERAPEFLPPGRFSFHRATFERTGLADGCAAGVVSVDSLNFSVDRAMALRELRRILAPGARAVFTATERPAGEADWLALLRSAGLTMVERKVNPHHDVPWRILYRSWQEHAADLRDELGPEATAEFLREAETVGPALGRAPALLLVATRDS